MALCKKILKKLVLQKPVIEHEKLCFWADFSEKLIFNLKCGSLAFVQLLAENPKKNYFWLDQNRIFGGIAAQNIKK
jgi:hypothetical protein